MVNPINLFWGSIKCFYYFTIYVIYYLYYFIIYYNLNYYLIIKEQSRKAHLRLQEKSERPLV